MTTRMKIALSGLSIGFVVGAVATARGQDGDAAAIRYRPEVLIQIGVSDMDRAVAFYTNILGFTLTERRDDLQFAHIASNVPGLEIGLSQLDLSKESKGSGSVVLNISVEDVNAARQTLESRGVVFRGDTEVIPGKVALAAFVDPDGNALRLAGAPEATGAPGPSPRRDDRANPTEARALRRAGRRAAR